MQLRVALIGFGVVGQSVCEVLISKSESLSDANDFSCLVVGVSDLRWGTVFNNDGLDLGQLLTEARDVGKFCKDRTDWDSHTLIRRCDADAVVELSYTDLETGEPAISHCRIAIETGKSVITSNKGPPALAHRELSELARHKGVQFLFEACVLSGTPVFNLANSCLTGNTITEIRGILNGTTNFMLDEMESGANYDVALARAQALGYAEAKPDADVEGYDALAKVVILANTLMGGDLKPSQVPCRGITEIDQNAVVEAKREGRRYKLIGAIQRDGNGLAARVCPEKLHLNDPLSSVSGVNNALTLETDLLGEITVIGPGAGPTATGYAVVGDLMRILTVH